MLGWIMQPVWFYYLYTGDRNWLRNRGYPLLRDPAVFYSELLKKISKSAGRRCVSIYAHQGRTRLDAQIPRKGIFARFSLNA